MTKLQVLQIAFFKQYLCSWIIQYSKFEKSEKLAIGPNLRNLKNLPLVQICGRRRIVLQIFPLPSLIFGPNLPLRSKFLTAGKLFAHLCRRQVFLTLQRASWECNIRVNPCPSKFLIPSTLFQVVLCSNWSQNLFVFNLIAAGDIKHLNVKSSLIDGLIDQRGKRGQLRNW